MSRIDWYSLVPPIIADRQIRWEQRRWALKLDALGYKKYEIAERLGLTIYQLRSLFHAARRNPDERAPVERWQEESGDIAALAEKLHIPIVRREKPRRPSFKAASSIHGAHISPRRRIS